MLSAGFKPIRFKKRSDTTPTLKQNVVKIEFETDEALVLFELLTSDRLKNVIDAVETIVLEAVSKPVWIDVFTGM